MNDVTKRFIQTYKEMGLTGYRMGKDCSSITKQKISNIEKGITEATVDMISDFCVIYSQVNSNYILTGRGNMFLSDEGQNINKDLEKEQNVSNEVSKAMLDVINEQKKEIDKLIKLTNILLDKLPNDEPMLENKKID